MRVHILLFTLLSSLFTLPFCHCGDKDELSSKNDKPREKKSMSVVSDDVFVDALTHQPTQDVLSTQDIENLQNMSQCVKNGQMLTSQNTNDDQGNGACGGFLNLLPSQSMEDGRSRTSSIEPVTLDISHPLTNLCKSIDVDIDGIPAEIFIPIPGVVVAKIVDGNTKVTNIDEKTSKLVACITFLKFNEPSILTVITRTPGGLSHKYYKNIKSSGCLGFHRTGWKEFKKNYTRKINAFRIRFCTSTKFPLDISDTFDSTNYRMIVHDFGIITARYYATKPGHIMEKISDQGVEILHFAQGAVCFLCEIHNKDNYSLMRLHIRKDYVFHYCYEKKQGTRWGGILNKAFDEALRRMYEDVRFSE